MVDRLEKNDWPYSIIYIMSYWERYVEVSYNGYTYGVVLNKRQDLISLGAARDPWDPTIDYTVQNTIRFLIKEDIPNINVCISLAPIE